MSELFETPKSFMKLRLLSSQVSISRNMHTGARANVRVPVLTIFLAAHPTVESHLKFKIPNDPLQTPLKCFKFDEKILFCSEKILKLF